MGIAGVIGGEGELWATCPGVAGSLLLRNDELDGELSCLEMFFESQVPGEARKLPLWRAAPTPRPGLAPAKLPGEVPPGRLKVEDFELFPPLRSEFVE